MAYGDSAYQRAQAAGEDIIGMDKLAKAFLRQLSSMPPGSIVGVLGGPGSGKTEFLRRVAWLVREQRDQLGKVHAGFRDLVEAATGGQGGRLVVFIEDMDHLVPSLRWSFLDALRLLSRSDAKVIVVAALGREAAIEAVRSHEGGHLTDH